MNDDHDNAVTDKEMLARSVQRDYGMQGARNSDLLDWIDGLNDEAVGGVLRWLAVYRPSVLRIAKRYHEGETEAELPPDAPYAEERCDTCRKVHKPPEVVGAGGVKFWPGHEYIIRTLVGTQKLPREWRMGYLGFGAGMQWSARGPDRTHGGGQYGGTQTMDLADIVYAEEVVRDDAKRHVGEIVRNESVPPEQLRRPSITDPHRTGWTRPTTRASQARSTPRDAPLA